MFNYIFLLSTTLCLLVLSVKCCPNYCRCYKSKNLGYHFECKGKNLVDVPENLDKNINVLSLSYNVLTKLNNHEFKGLVNTVYLSLDHNHINDIQLHSFSGLNRLQTLDLSWNSIRHIQDKTFVDNARLEHLNLAGNPLGTSRLCIFSQTVKELNLSNCGLSYLEEKMFTNLPNIQTLYLTSNSLIEVSTLVLNKMTKLQMIDLTGNSMQCTEKVLEMENHLIDNNVQFRHVCEQSELRILGDVTPKMMEKMIRLPDNNEESEEDEDDVNKSEENRETGENGDLDEENTEMEENGDLDEENTEMEENGDLDKKTPSDVTINIGNKQFDRLIAFTIVGVIGFQIGTVFGIILGYFCLGKYKKSALGRNNRPRSILNRGYTDLPPGTPPPPYRQHYGPRDLSDIP